MSLNDICEKIFGIKSDTSDDSNPHPDDNVKVSPVSYSEQLWDDNKIQRSSQDYSDAGIQIQRTDDEPPEFYFEGTHISHTCADEIADFYSINNRRPLNNEIKIH